MDSKRNRRNTDFQIVYFLVGSCHTPDGAHALLCDLRDERESALLSSQAAIKRNYAKRLRAEKMLDNDDICVVAEAEADIMDIDAGANLMAQCITAAQDELATINKCIERLAPYRAYAHLTDAQACEAAQREEWREELIRRAENCYLAGGPPPPDQIAAMRMHPDFKTAIWPALKDMELISKVPDGREAIIGARKPLFIDKIMDAGEV